MADTRHVAGSLKQKNKTHKVQGGHRSKGQLADAARGRVDQGSGHKGARRHILKREARRLQAGQIRSNKRAAALANKRSRGSASAAPTCIVVVPLQASEEDAANMCSQLHAAGTGEEVAEGTYHQNTFFCPRLKKRVTVIPSPRDMAALLDLSRVADTLMFLVRAGVAMDDFAETAVSTLCAQGVPTTCHVVLGLEQLAVKRRSDLRRAHAKDATSSFPDTKVHSVEKPGDVATILWTTVAQKRRRVRWRETRPHVIAQDVSYDPENEVMQVTGFVRGRALSANSLVYLPGHGACQLGAVLAAADPCPCSGAGRRGEVRMNLAPGTVLAEPDERQESLVTEVAVDPMEGEQTWPTEEEMAGGEGMVTGEEGADGAAATGSRVVRVPKGTSSYQAAWFVDEEEGGESGPDDGMAVSEGEEEGEEEGEGGNGDVAPAAVEPLDEMEDLFSKMKGVRFDDEQGLEGEELEHLRAGLGQGAVDSEEEFEEVELGDAAAERAAGYDRDIDMEEEEEMRERIRRAREDAVFPDEVDTPMNM